MRLFAVCLLIENQSKLYSSIQIHPAVSSIHNKDYKMCSSSIQNSSLCSYKIATRGKPITRMDFVRPQGAILYCEATFCIWLRTSVLLWESDWMLKVCFYKYELMTRAKSPKAQSQIILISFYIVVPKGISLPLSIKNQRNSRVPLIALTGRGERFAGALA